MTSHDNALPITTLLPEAAAEPVVLFDKRAALRSKTDCTAKDAPDWVRAIKRLPRKYGYPPAPDSYAPAADLILRQAEVIANDEVA